MFDSFINYISLVIAFKGLLFKRIASPLQTKRFVELGRDIKVCVEKEEDKIQAIINVLDLLIAFKKTYPSDYEEIFTILDEILEAYEENPKIKSYLKELLD